MCRMETQKKRRISPIPFNRFSPSFQHSVSGYLFLVSDDLDNVGQCQNLQEFSFLKLEYC